MLTRRDLLGGVCAAFISGRVRAEDQTTQDRPPEWRDKADVCIIDLKDRTIQTVCSTSAFGMQTGAQAQWGRSDRLLYFNDKTGRAKGPAQEGYGCAIAPERRLRLSSRAARDQGLDFYLFHSKFNPQGTRIRQVVRLRDPKQEIPGYSCLLLTTFRSDGSDFRLVMRYIFTDAYPKEPMTLPNGEVPLRLIDTRADRETTLATIYTLGRQKQNILRLDPHPAWSRDWKPVCFNGAPDGRRQLFIAGLRKLLV